MPVQMSSLAWESLDSRVFVLLVLSLAMVPTFGSCVYLPVPESNEASSCSLSASVIVSVWGISILLPCFLMRGELLRAESGD